MRFGCFMTRLSILFLGSSCHPYIGPRRLRRLAVFTASSPLLVPLSSKPSCPRRRIPRLRGGVRFLGNPSGASLAVDGLLPGVSTRPGERARRLHRFWHPFCVALGSCFPPGLRGGGCRSGAQPPAPNLFPFWASPLTRVVGLFVDYDGSTRVRFRYP